ncbi:MAG TPA: DNA-3-methyladenine glycosylase 2 family protein, partial [Nordella sp.]|nr:DNA-3-methyladenine glycosylase 2 family protein [Nordella sp.]
LGREPRFGTVIELHGLPPLRRAEGGLPGLLRIVTEQMISLQAADAIWQRIARELAPLDPPSILRRRHATLMKLGLSGAKSRTFHALARAAHRGEFRVESLHRQSDDELIAALVALPGIGPWTADIYVLSCLGRADAWPTGDLALQAAAAQLFGLAARPDARAMTRLAEDWRPWRSVAARLLWSHYRSLKGLPQAVV